MTEIIEVILPDETLTIEIHTPGLPGARGIQGLSAYEVAVAEGFVGTEAEWLESLQGAPGDPGGGSGAGLSDEMPAALGTAGPGDGTLASRDDHVHPMPSAADVGAATAAQGIKADSALQPNDGLAALDSTANAKLAGIATGAEVNVNADWNAGSGDAQILNKPTLGTAAATAATDYATAAQGALADSALQPNAAITGATKTKITYDADGLVTAGADATTADIADSSNKRYVTDAQLTVIGNTSNVNSGDQTSVTGNAGTATALQTARTIDGQSFNGTANITVIAPGTNAATGKTTPVDADMLPLVDSAASNVLKKLTWANLKATAKTYFDTLYQATLVSGTNIKTVNSTSLLGSGDIAISGGSPAGSTTELQINNAGAFGAATGVTWASNQLLVTAQAAGTTPFSVKGATSQTAYLATFQSSTGVVGAKVRADGKLAAASVDGAIYLDDTSAPSSPTYMYSYSTGYGIAWRNRYAAADAMKLQSQLMVKGLAVGAGGVIGSTSNSYVFESTSTDTRQSKGTATVSYCWLMAPVGIVNNTKAARDGDNVGLWSGKGSAASSGNLDGGDGGDVVLRLGAGGAGIGTGGAGRNGRVRIQNDSGTDVARITGTGVLQLLACPTSSAGLSTGDVWSNAGVLTIV